MRRRLKSPLLQKLLERIAGFLPDQLTSHRDRLVGIFCDLRQIRIFAVTFDISEHRLHDRLPVVHRGIVA